MLTIVWGVWIGNIAREKYVFPFCGLKNSLSLKLSSISNSISLNVV